MAVNMVRTPSILNPISTGKQTQHFDCISFLIVVYISFLVVAALVICLILSNSTSKGDFISYYSYTYVRGSS